MFEARVESIALHVVGDLAIPALGALALEHAADHAGPARLHARELRLAHPPGDDRREFDLRDHRRAARALLGDLARRLAHGRLDLGEHLAIMGQRRAQFPLGLANGGGQVVDVEGHDVVSVCCCG